MHLVVSLRLVASSQGGGQTKAVEEERVWKSLSNSSILVEGLRPATWYTAIVATIKASDNATFVNKAYARTLPDGMLRHPTSSISPTPLPLPIQASLSLSTPT